MRSRSFRLFDTQRCISAPPFSVMYSSTAFLVHSDSLMTSALKSTDVNLTRSFLDPVSAATLAACCSAFSRRLFRAPALNGSWLASYKLSEAPERVQTTGSSST